LLTWPPLIAWLPVTYDTEPREPETGV
jgi:hypothetical protein